MPKGKIREKEEARRLRRNGKSLNEIVREVGVSKGSVSRWVRDIGLTEEQEVALKERNPCEPRHGVKARKKASAAWRRRWMQVRLGYQKEGRDRASKNGLDLYLAGCMLYWAEGTKNRNQVRFSNCDPNMVFLFVRFLRECLTVESEKFKLSVNCYTGNGKSVEEIEDYWLDLLVLKRGNLNKTFVDHDGRGGRGKTKHVFGCCTVAVYSSELVQQIYGAIQEYAGFDCDSFLD